METKIKATRLVQQHACGNCLLISPIPNEKEWKICEFSHMMGDQPKMSNLHHASLFNTYITTFFSKINRFRWKVSNLSKFPYIYFSTQSIRSCQGAACQLLQLKKTYVALILYSQKTCNFLSFLFSTEWNAMSLYARFNLEK